MVARTRKRIIRYSILTANLVLVGVVVALVWGGSNNSQSSTLSTSINASTTAANPLDQLSSTDIAANVARLAQMPESTSLRNEADSVNALLNISAADQTVVAKPLVVATAFKSNRDIKVYVTKAGDTVSKLAIKFGVPSESIMDSNQLSSDQLISGQTLYIPPFPGIVYIVRSGDTPASLAKRFSANQDQIIHFNDAEISGLKVGTRIVIPNGQISVAAPVYAGTPISSFVAQYGDNGYAYGFCTWYVASKIPVPSNWGNAYTWAYYARISGWNVSGAARVGAIAQTTAGFGGHVAIVEAVSPDGSQIKYSDMNGIAGWGAVGFSDWVPLSHFQNYIYR